MQTREKCLLQRYRVPNTIAHSGGKGNLGQSFLLESFSVAEHSLTISLV